MIRFISLSRANKLFTSLSKTLKIVITTPVATTTTITTTSVCKFSFSKDNKSSKQDKKNQKNTPSNNNTTTTTTIKQQNSTSSATLIQKRKLLQKVLKQVGLRQSKSLFLHKSNIFEAEEDSKNLYQQNPKKLTKREKQLLGIFLPTHPIGTRMGFNLQKNYRKEICENLYHVQSQYLKTGVRILQQSQQSSSYVSQQMGTGQSLPKGHLSLSRYINIVYKDIYARFLISKGVGVEWNSELAPYGVMNPVKKKASIDQSSLLTFLRKSIPFMQTKPVIGPYSYFMNKFINPKSMQVENIRKLGYYIKLPLIGFGKYKKEFKKLIENGHQIKMLVFCEYAHKLINPQCLCLGVDGKMVILKKNIQTNTKSSHAWGQDLKLNIKKQFLITSLETFNKHKQQFVQKQKYQKHTIFQAKHLLQMQVGYGKAQVDIETMTQQKDIKQQQNLTAADEQKTQQQQQSQKQQQQTNTTCVFKKKLKIITQIEGYERNQNIYLVDGSHNIADYQRIANSNSEQITGFKIHDLKNNFSRNGAMLSAPYGCAKNIVDIQFQSQLIQIYKESNRLQFVEIYDVFEDQAYMHAKTKELLFFKLYDKVYIPIQQQSYEDFQHGFVQKGHQNQTFYLHESKIQIPRPQPSLLRKPRDRRRHRKYVEQLKQQKTLHMHLSEALNSLTNIPISTGESTTLGDDLQNDQSGSQSHQLKSSEIREVRLIRQKASSRILEVLPVSKNGKEVYYPANVKTYQQRITLSKDLIQALSFINLPSISSIVNSSASDSSLIPSVIIQPQSSTQEYIALGMHLHLFIKKHLESKRGRRGSPSVSFSKPISHLLQTYKMIYLHPTVTEKLAQASVQSFIEGSMKLQINRSNGTEGFGSAQSTATAYGYGYEAIRMWVCEKGDYLGDRVLQEKQINDQLKNGQFIRKLFDELVPLLEIGKQDSIQYFQDQTFKQRNSQMKLLDKFMLDHIDMFILNMEYFYSKLMLKQAYSYAMDFYRNLVDPIFVETVRYNMITYPNNEQNKSHKFVIRRLMQTLACTAPLFPFTVYHINKGINLMKWPKPLSAEKCYQSAHDYNTMIKIRQEIRNRIAINKFENAEIVYPVQESICEHSDIQLQEFYGVRKVSKKQPVHDERKFQHLLRKGEILGRNVNENGKMKVKVYEYRDTCIRCDPKKKQNKFKEHLCVTCVRYLQKEVGEKVVATRPSQITNIAIQN